MHQLRPHIQSPTALAVPHEHFPVCSDTAMSVLFIPEHIQGVQGKHKLYFDSASLNLPKEELRKHLLNFSIIIFFLSFSIVCALSPINKTTASITKNLCKWNILSYPLLTSDEKADYILDVVIQEQSS